MPSNPRDLVTPTTHTVRVFGGAFVPLQIPVPGGSEFVIVGDTIRVGNDEAFPVTLSFARGDISGFDAVKIEAGAVVEIKVVKDRGNCEIDDISQVGGIATGIKLTVKMGGGNDDDAGRADPR